MTCEEFHEAIDIINERNKQLTFEDDIMVTGSELIALNRHLLECPRCRISITMRQLQLRLTDPETYQRATDCFERVVKPRMVASVLSDQEVQP